MASILPSVSKLAVLGAAALHLEGAAMAQSPDRTPDRAELHELTSQSGQQQPYVAANADKDRTELDRKIRAMDRRMKRVLQSICIGC
jgi:hypothetical protein